MNSKTLLLIGIGLFIIVVPCWAITSGYSYPTDARIMAVEYPFLPVSGSGEVTDCSLAVNPQYYTGDILDYRLAVDYSRIVTPDTDVLMFGETHNIAQGKRELAWNMHLFKELGFTHLGLEMFTTDIQFMLDEFNRTGENRAEILQYLYGQWGYPSMAEEYQAILDAARAEGIQIIALDMPGREQGMHQDFMEQLTARNEYMSRVISGILEQGTNRRVITLNGALHLEGMSGIMHGQYAINATSVAFTGGKKSEFDNEEKEAEASIECSAAGFAERDTPDLDVLYANTLIKSAVLEMGSLIENAARGIGLYYTKFMLKVIGDGDSVACCDWFIHLPQTE